MRSLKGLLAALVLVAASFGASAEPEVDSPTGPLRAAIERNWLIPLGVPNLESYTVSLRLHVTPDGLVKQIEVLDDSDDPSFRTVAESARRAILITQNELGRWPMKLICEQAGGC